MTAPAWERALVWAAMLALGLAGWWLLLTTIF